MYVRRQAHFQTGFAPGLGQVATHHDISLSLAVIAAAGNRRKTADFSLALPPARFAITTAGVGRDRP